MGEKETPTASEPGEEGCVLKIATFEGLQGDSNWRGGGNLEHFGKKYFQKDEILIPIRCSSERSGLVGLRRRVTVVIWKHAVGQKPGREEAEESSSNGRVGSPGGGSEQTVKCGQGEWPEREVGARGELRAVVPGGGRAR